MSEEMIDALYPPNSTPGSPNNRGKSTRLVRSGGKGSSLKGVGRKKGVPGRAPEPNWRAPLKGRKRCDLEKRFVQFCRRLRRGLLHGDAMMQSKISWERIVELIELHDEYRDMYDEGLIQNAAYRQRLREDEADRRALEGVTTRTFNSRGRLVRKTITPSDKLLALQLEAGDPDKYRKAAPGLTVNNLNVAPDTVNTLKQIFEDNKNRDSLLPGDLDDGGSGDGGDLVTGSCATSPSDGDEGEPESRLPSLQQIAEVTGNK